MMELKLTPEERKQLAEGLKIIEENWPNCPKCKTEASALRKVLEVSKP